MIFVPKAVEKAGEVLFGLVGALLSPLGKVIGENGSATLDWVLKALGRGLRRAWAALTFFIGDNTDNKTSAVVLVCWTIAAFLAGGAWHRVKHPPLPEPVSAARCDAKIKAVVDDLHSRFRFVPKR